MPVRELVHPMQPSMYPLKSAPHLVSDDDQGDDADRHPERRRRAVKPLGRA